MNYTIFSEILTEAFAKNNLDPPSAEQSDLFFRFTQHLTAVNAHTNLTAIRDISDMIYKHYVDSLLAAAYLPIGVCVLDIGCGAGFPSIPLAIFRPDLSIVGLDSTAKKVAFVNESAKLLHLNNLTALAGRAEDAAVRRKLGEFDIVTARAVSRLHVLCELCLPYLKIGGKFLALKGAQAAEELSEAEKAIHLLGGEKAILHKHLLVSSDALEARGIIEISKISATPPQYPRQYAAILKKPL